MQGRKKERRRRERQRKTGEEEPTSGEEMSVRESGGGERGEREDEKQKEREGGRKSQKRKGGEEEKRFGRYRDVQGVPPGEPSALVRTNCPTRCNTTRVFVEWAWEFRFDVVSRNRANTFYKFLFCYWLEPRQAGGRLAGRTDGWQLWSGRPTHTREIVEKSHVKIHDRA